MSALKYLNATYPISSLQGPLEIFKNEFAVHGQFYIQDASDASAYITRAVNQPIDQYFNSTKPRRTKTIVAD